MNMKIKLAAVSVALLVSSVVSQAAPAPVYCQCVDYVKNKLVLSGTTGGAKNMGNFLSKFRYTQAPILPSLPPVNKDIMVIQPSYGRGIDAINGHVGFVSSVKVSGSNIIVDLVSTNMRKPNERTDAGCNNVSNTTFTINSFDLAGNKVAFYRK